MKITKKEEKAITLVALVVTIIVLLILAGIAINLTVGNNGLFSRAQNAANTWKKAEKDEANEMKKIEELYDDTLNEENRKTIKIILDEIELSAYENESLSEWVKRTDLTKIKGLSKYSYELKDYLLISQSPIYGSDHKTLCYGDELEYAAVWEMRLKDGIKFEWTNTPS